MIRLEFPEGISTFKQLKEKYTLMKATLVAECHDNIGQDISLIIRLTEENETNFVDSHEFAIDKATEIKAVGLDISDFRNIDEMVNYVLGLLLFN